MYNIPNFVIIQSWDILIKMEVANNGPENNDAFIRCDVGLCRSYLSTLSPKTTFAQGVVWWSDH